MALTRITKNVIKDSTITESKFENTYLDARQSDIAEESIIFQSAVKFRSGSSGIEYLIADSTTGIVNLQSSSDEVTVLNISTGSITVSGNVTVSNGKVQGAKVAFGDGLVTEPSLYFSSATNLQTGFYRETTPNNSISVAIDGVKTLGISSQAISLGSNRIDILTTVGNYTEIIGFNNNTSTFGGTNTKLSIKVADTDVINVRSVDNSDVNYTNGEKRVGINVNNPTAMLDVGGKIKATEYEGIGDSSLPVVPITKGGTGISSTGVSEQLIRVNAARTGFEYFTFKSGDINNLGSFNVSGDPSIYKVNGYGNTTFEGASGFLQLSLDSISSWRVGQDIKIFGVNTKDLDSYSSGGSAGNLYNQWKTNQVEIPANKVTPNGADSSSVVRYTYYAALLNTKTGVVSSLARLNHDAPPTEGNAYVVNFPLGNFNNTIYNTVKLPRPISNPGNHAILLYRKIQFITGNPTPVNDRDGNLISGHNDRYNLIAIIGQRDIGNSTTQNFIYQDYGPFDRTTWSDLNEDGTYSYKYQEMTNIKVSYTEEDIIANKPSIPGWTIRTVLEIDETNKKLTISGSSNSTTDETNLTKLDTYTSGGSGQITYFDGADTNTEVPSELVRSSEDYPRYNDIQICHDDTLGIQTAIDQQVIKGLRSLFLIGGTYLVRRLSIPSNFSLIGSGKASILKKQYFDNEFELNTGVIEYNRTYAALWLRNPVDSLGAASESTSQPIRDVTVRDLVIDGNYNSNIRFGLNTLPESNTLVYADEINNVNFSSLDIKNSIGDALTVKNSTRVSIQNCNIFDNSLTYQTFDNPLQATDTTVLKVSDTAFLSNPGPADITTSEVVAFNSCIIRNSGTGLRIFGARSTNTENNLILGPDDEWIPTEDIYDSDYNSVNITCDKTSGTGTGGKIKFTYLENNVAKDLTNTTVSTSVYKIKVDTAGNELIDGGPLVYRLNDQPTNSEISVLDSQVTDGVNGGVEISIPSGRIPDPSNGGSNYDVSLTSGQAVHVIPYRKTFESGLFQNNYNYIIYTLFGDETVAVGGADSYMIEGATEYDNIKNEYVIAIKFDNLTDFQVGDIITLREHNTPYNLPTILTVAQRQFSSVVNSWTLRLQYNSIGETFNQFLAANNSSNGEFDSGNNTLNALANGAQTSQDYKGYIEKRRSFTIAKGIIGVV